MPRTTPSISESRIEISSVETTLRPDKCNNMDLMIVVTLTYVLAPGLLTYGYQDIQMLSSQKQEKPMQAKTNTKYQVFVSFLIRLFTGERSHNPRKQVCSAIQPKS